MSAMSTASLPVTGGVVPNRFFGPEFSIDRSKFERLEPEKVFQSLMYSSYLVNQCEIGADNSERSPRTPKTHDGNEKGHRKILEQRRTLVMELFNQCGYFPMASDTAAFQVRSSLRSIHFKFSHLFKFTCRKNTKMCSHTNQACN